MRAGSKRQISGAINRLFHTGTAVGLSDGQLLERFILSHDEGAESAFNVLLERHGPMVLAVCQRVLHDPHDAQDAFQATFLVLVRKAGSVRKRESIADWLYGVALRVSAHARAGSARRRSIERRTVTEPLIAYEMPPDIDVRDEVEHLPHDLRSAVVLCYLEGLTHEQAARRLGWPVGTVRSRLARARARLRADLTRRGTGPDSALLTMLAFRTTSLPEGLIDATVKAAIWLAARDAGEAGLVSASAVALTEGVLRTMLFSKWKMTIAILLTVGALTSGIGLYAYQDVKPTSAPEDLKPPPAKVGNQNVDELDVYAARVEQLVRSARQKQAGSEWDRAVSDLHKTELAVGAWREALLRRRRSAKAQDPPSPTPVETPASTPIGSDSTSSSDRRIEDLERKVNRILQALEKGGSGPLQPAGSVVPNKPVGRRHPPNLEGLVQRIDNKIGRVDINRGSDDGLMQDDELAVYRKDRSPRSGKPEYLGRIRIVSVNPDQAVANLIAWEGKEIKEGDCVSTEPESIR